MNIKHFLGIFAMLTLLWSCPSRAANDNPEVKALLSSLLPTMEDYLAFGKDKTESAKPQMALADTNAVLKADAFWSTDDKSYVLIYRHLLPSYDTVVVSILTYAKDEEEFQKRRLQLTEQYKAMAANGDLKLIKIDLGNNSRPDSKYFFIEAENDSSRGNLFLIPHGRHFLTISVSGAFQFKDAETIEKFLSGKIEKAFSFVPDEKSPNFPPAE
ncbi:MAG: hypothetical protein ACREO1_15325 [Arenimonas sp.]